MNGGRCLEALALLEAIDLVELTSTADLQTREDRKYIVRRRDADSLIARADARALEIGGIRTFRYESVYFDTADLASYLGAARRRPRRFKVRTRSYLDSASCMLEVKTRDGRGRTVKHRLPYELERRDALTPDGRDFIRSIAAAAPSADELTPTLATTYRRSTLVVGSGLARITIDDDLRWSRPDGVVIHVPDLALVETKTCGPPCSVDRLLWRDGYRPTVISKYCTGLAALTPGLPANKWHRVLHRHLDLQALPSR